MTNFTILYEWFVCVTLTSATDYPRFSIHSKVSTLKQAFEDTITVFDAEVQALISDIVTSDMRARATLAVDHGCKDE